MPHGEFDFSGPVDQAVYALKPGQIPDDTFMTQQGIDQQTEHLGSFLTQQDEKYATAHLGGMDYFGQTDAALAVQAARIVEEARKEAEQRGKMIRTVAIGGAAALAAYFLFFRK